jgi:hypothetical protein
VFDCAAFAFRGQLLYTSKTRSLLIPFIPRPLVSRLVYRATQSSSRLTERHLPTPSNVSTRNPPTSSHPSPYFTAPPVQDPASPFTLICLCLTSENPPRNIPCLATAPASFDCDTHLSSSSTATKSNNDSTPHDVCVALIALLVPCPWDTDQHHPPVIPNLQSPPLYLTFRLIFIRFLC